MLGRSRAARRAAQARTEVALAGAGYVAVVHALAAQAAGMRVRSVASAGGSSARHLAGSLDARRCRPEELPDGAAVLVVATPPDAHVDLALQGLRAGAHVLVEKPLAPTLADADRLVAAAEQAAATGRRVHCAENLLHAPLWQAAMARRPALGTLTHLSLRTVQPPPDWGHFQRPLTAGGVLFDLGPHPIAVALGLAAEDPVAVTAELSSTRSDEADDHADVRLRFASGLVATLVVSWRGEEVVWDAQAASATGVLRLELLPELVLEANGEPVEVATRYEAADPRIEQLGYVDQLLALVGDDPAAGQSVQAARGVLEVLCAAYESARLGVEVALPFGGDRAVTPLQLWRG
jgi:predicted dehydrogenase